MSHAHRFFVPPEQAREDRIALPPDEAHHAQHVLRVRVGEAVELFDGAGGVLHGEVAEVRRHAVRVRVREREVIAPPAQRLVLVQATLNREKNLEALLQRATELSVAEVRVFRGDHSERAPRLRDKWRRLAIESCKQCGRVRLPAFTAYRNLDDALRGLDGALLVAALDRAAVSIREAVQGYSAAAVIVGPEGDLSAREVDAALSLGAKPISLGPHVLRSEIAATVACALVGYELGLLASKRQVDSPPHR